MSGCFVLTGNKLQLQVKSKNVKALNAEIASLDVSNNLITINGSGLSDVKTLKIKGTGIDESLVISSQTSSQSLDLIFITQVEMLF